MSPQEQAVTKRRIAQRNVARLKAFSDRGELKDELVGALREANADGAHEAAPVE